MTSVRGHFNGSVIVLDEPAPVDHEVEVLVHFPAAPAATSDDSARSLDWHWEESRRILGEHTEPDEDDASEAPESRPLRWWWDNAAAVRAQFDRTLSEEVLRQRGRFDVTPSGLPEQMPSDEEWKRRAEELGRMLKQWAAEEPGEDLADPEELRAALRANPVRFREALLDE